MENISLLLSDALAPYCVSLAPSDRHGRLRLTVSDQAGAAILHRDVAQSQLADKRALTDVVDGLHRDLMIAEGRLEPSMIAALRAACAGGQFAVEMH
ncbi:DUF3509 domain-containing protein [Pseudomonas sp. RIT-PI-S]|uniref:DUF3509 domain-containing protein n=1 Tax=Pseudomonas sp. RIT-PI-S TaxID=3035295 RepID=UPI0021DAE116|nr:DUF3509 domain-containing protein [Pseudomonas sp. RIT-PI-S]